MKKHVFFVLISLYFFTNPCMTFSMERFDIITTQELNQMLKDRAAGKIDFILMNALDEIIYKNSSIPGSVNVPWNMVKKIGRKRLGPDNEKLIVTY